MKSDTNLTLTSLLAIVLTSLHLTDDIVRGIGPAGLTMLVGVLVLTTWLYATLVLTRRRWRYVILLLGSLFAAAMPIAHMSGKAFSGKFVASSGAYFSVSVLIALGVVGSFSAVLSARELHSLRTKKIEGGHA